MKQILLLTGDDLFADFLCLQISKEWHDIKVFREISSEASKLFHLLLIDYSFPNQKMEECLDKIENITDVPIIGLYNKDIPENIFQKIKWIEKDENLFSVIENELKSNYFPISGKNEAVNQSNKGNGELIIFADDSKVVRQTLSSLLHSQNYITESFENGRLLIDALEQGKTPGLIILDNEMPVMSGPETLLLLKKNENWKEIPVLFLSGVTDKDVIVKALENGAADYIGKPFHNNELFARVNVHLRLNQMKKQLVEKNRTIEEKNRKITASISYAKRIQEAVLSKEKELGEFFPENFILYKPLEIVSGDFYWFKQSGDYFVLAVADCTGHGVPGAFMSMLGMGFLNEILRKKESHIEACEILNELRRDVKTALRQTGAENEAKDGMDIVLCVFNLKEKKLQYAGANNPLWIIRNGELTEYKGDRMPVGIHHIEKESFTNHEIDIQQGDSLYMFSDGFQDQFGGEQSRKFFSKNVKALLLENQSKSLAEQKIVLDTTHTNWKGTENPQTDDILFVGIKIVGC